MRNWIGFLCLAVLAVAAVIGWQWHSRGSRLPAHTHASYKSDPEAILGVDDLMQNVDRYQGVLQVEGVVSRASSKDQTLALIDAEEFRQCGTTTCARLTLPVRWTGTLPSVEDTVLLEGEVQNLGGKLLFVARKLEKVEPQTRGTK